MTIGTQTINGGNQTFTQTDNKAIIKGALRAATLQNMLLDHINSINMHLIKKQFLFAFPMGEHLFNKLINNFDSNVPKWLRSLDCENEKLFFTSEHLEFLN